MDLKKVCVSQRSFENISLQIYQSFLIILIGSEYRDQKKPKYIQEFSF